jgi:hypothetical protein
MTNVFLGLLMLEWAWCKIQILKNVDEERDGKYPAFRRWDAHKWQKWRFYFGAVTFLPLRLFLSLALVIICYIFVR